MIIIEDFQKLDIRVGKIISAEDFPEARKPMYKIKIDFGAEIGVKQSCAQLTQNYTKDQLINKMILGVVNLLPRKIGPEISEVLILGFPDKDGNCILIIPDHEALLGAKLY